MLPIVIPEDAVPQNIPASDGPTLELADVYAARIQPRDASKVMKALSSKASLAPALGHLKRIRRDDNASPPVLTVLLYPCDPAILGADALLPLDGGGLPGAVREILGGCSAEGAGGVEVEVVQVPRWGAGTREQWEEWSAHWPMTFHPTESHLPNTENKLLPSEEEQMRRLMGMAVGLAGGVGGGPCSGNCCLLADPVTGEVVASSAALPPPAGEGEAGGGEESRRVRSEAGPGAHALQEPKWVEN